MVFSSVLIWYLHFFNRIGFNWFPLFFSFTNEKLLSLCYFFHIEWCLGFDLFDPFRAGNGSSNWFAEKWKIKESLKRMSKYIEFTESISRTKPDKQTGNLFMSLAGFFVFPSLFSLFSRLVFGWWFLSSQVCVGFISKIKNSNEKESKLHSENETKDKRKAFEAANLKFIRF